MLHPDIPYPKEVKCKEQAILWLIQQISDEYEFDEYNRMIIGLEHNEEIDEFYFRGMNPCVITICHSNTRITFHYMETLGYHIYEADNLYELQYEMYKDLELQRKPLVRLLKGKDYNEFI